MSIQPKIHIIKDDTEKTLELFTQSAREESAEKWRCLYANIEKDLVTDPESKAIVFQFLKESFFDADNVTVYIHPEGHLFIFFQGYVRSCIRSFETFLDQIKSDKSNERADYNFFWEIDHFWGYFDEVLSRTLQQPNQTRSATETALNARSRRAKPLLLILEDDRTTRHFLHAMMREHCDIVVTWNAQRAEKLYKDLMPNLAFLDVEVPYGDGEDLAKKLCRYDQNAFIVMISGSLTPAREKRCLDYGVKGCVSKPPQRETLLGYLELYKSEKEKNQKASG